MSAKSLFPRFPGGLDFGTFHREDRWVGVQGDFPGSSLEAPSGVREDGSLIAPNDPEWDSLTTRATAARTDPQAWLAPHTDLMTADRFVSAFSRALDAIWQSGARSAIRTFVASRQARVLPLCLAFAGVVTI